MHIYMLYFERQRSTKIADVNVLISGILLDLFFLHMKGNF